jgi:hypothetical protein
MKYDITTNKAPEMPNLGKGTECIKLLLSKASKDIYDPLFPMFFPSLGAHISDAEFQYPVLTIPKYPPLFSKQVALSAK